MAKTKTAARPALAKTSAKKPAPAKAKKSDAKPGPAARADAADKAAPPEIAIVRAPIAADLPIDAVFASPLNPRRAMEPEGLALLADSIAANGMLQPVLARPAPPARHSGAPRYELICGARRLAAAQLAVKDGRLPKDYRLPARVRACGDAELVELAATENLDREDMHPLDEAAVFAALRKYVKPPAGLTVQAAIGKKLGVVERTVFRRLALLRLAPELQKALRDGAINIGEAVAFSIGTHNDQRAHLKTMGTQEWQRAPGRIRHVMAAKRVAAGDVPFDPALYDGAVLVDEETGERFFTDAALVARLAGAALEAKRAELAKTWPWVEIVVGDHIPWNDFTVLGQGAKDKDAGAVICKSADGPGFEVATNIMKRATLAARAKAKGMSTGDDDDDAAQELDAIEESDPVTKARRDHLIPWERLKAVKTEKTRALRLAAADSQPLALALAIMGIMGCGGLGIEAGYGAVDHLARSADETLLRSRLLAPVGAAVRAWELAHPDEADDDSSRWNDDAADFEDFDAFTSEIGAVVLPALLALPVGRLLDILALVAAGRIATGPGTTWQPEYGDDPLAMQIAAAAGLTDGPAPPADCPPGERIAWRFLPEVAMRAELGPKAAAAAEAAE